MSKTIACPKCGSIDLTLQTKGTQTALICKDCGRWIKWVGKEEQRLIEFQIKSNTLDKKIEELKAKVNPLAGFDNIDLIKELYRRVEEGEIV